jgi:D-alanine-D-alanine ligase
MTALDQAGHEVVPIGITRQGRWLAAGDPHAALSSGATSGEQAATLLPEPGQTGLVGRVDAASVPGGPLDIVFPVLHGTFGEDGTVQGLFELASLPYVGSGVLGSALGMDKIVQKMLWRGLGLPVVDFLPTSRREIEREPDSLARRVESELGYPCFTKPANLGSSVGVSKARNPDELRCGLADAARYDSRVIVERGVNARELEVGVLGNDEPLTSVVGEIVANAEFYDYRAKYLDSGSQAIIPAEVPPGVAEDVQRLAVDAFRSVSAAGLARVDFFLDRDSDRLYLNEVNTMPASRGSACTRSCGRRAG